MKVYTGEEVTESKGRMILLYGKTAVGKTVTTLLTAPAPVFLLQTENRNLEPTLECIRMYRPELLKSLGVGYYGGFQDTMEFLNRESKSLDKYRTIVVDSLTDLMAIKLSQEIQNETYDAKTEDEKKKKQLISQSKLTLEGYGGVASQTLRFTDTVARYTRDGKYVVLLARLDESPSWARHYSFAPLLKGKEYGKDFEGMFDLVGYVESRTEENVDTHEWKIVFPPGVSFESSSGSFMAKWTGAGDNKIRKLNLAKILNVPMDAEV